MASLREDIDRWGLIRSLYVRVLWRLEKYLGFRLFVVHTRPLDATAPIEVVPDGSSAGVLGVDELMELARDPALDLAEEFVGSAYERGDICFGYLELGTLVAYAWKATKPAPVETRLSVHFSDGYIYGFKAFTLPSHRGRHLQECLSHLSDRWFTSRGYRHTIDYTDATNLASIAADRRHGNRAVGYVGCAKWFGRIVTFRSPGVKARGFGFFIPTGDAVGCS